MLQNAERVIDFKFPKEAAGLVIFVTGTGCHLRHLVNRIDEVGCIIAINQATITQLSKNVGIPACIKELGAKKEDFELMVNYVSADVCTGTNP